jgi:hypothetical protein
MELAVKSMFCDAGLEGWDAACVPVPHRHWGWVLQSAPSAVQAAHTTGLAVLGRYRMHQYLNYSCAYVAPLYCQHFLQQLFNPCVLPASLIGWPHLSNALPNPPITLRAAPFAAVTSNL